MFYKHYEYLIDSYTIKENERRQKIEFLSQIDGFINQKQYIKLTLLDWNENALKEIQGEIISGSLSDSGTSAVRKTFSFNATVGYGKYSIEDMQMDFSVNKKIYVEIGVKNYTDEYKEYPILWFPQGIFFIGSFSSSSSSSGISISVVCKDKMSMLNGEIGGTIPATTIFDEVDTQDASGKYVSEKVLLYNIIQEAVHHFGNEDLNNIVIEDVDTRIKRVMKWTGDNPLYLIPQEVGQNETPVYIASVDPLDADGKTGVIEKHNGDDCGYIYDDFFYTEELTLSLGDSVTTLLDKIVSYLGGNYEYFYDEYGVFHFREIRNYLNTTQGKLLLSSMGKNDYLVDTTLTKSEYTFTDDTNIISINVVPQYENIKNDYIVQGIRKLTGTDISYPIRYHLAIDNKPIKNYTDISHQSAVYEPRKNFLLFKEKDTDIVKGIFPLCFNDESELPEVGNFNMVYRYRPYIRDEAGNSTGELSKDFTYSYWNGNEYEAVEILKNDEDLQIGWYPGGTSPINEPLKYYWPQDWRTELYIQGLLAKNNGTDQGYYFAELESGWPLIYDLLEQKFFGEQVDEQLQASALTDGNYFLDFIDPSTSALGEYSISNIGRRTDAVNNEDINCLFAPEIPNIIFINNKDDNVEDLRAEADAKGEPWSQTSPEIYWALATGGYKNDAFTQIKFELNMHTNAKKTISLTSIPIFYIRSNTRVTLNDKSTNSYGDFILSNITTTFGSGGVSSVTLSESYERM